MLYSRVSVVTVGLVLFAVLAGVNATNHSHFVPLEDPADSEYATQTCSCPVYETPDPIDCKGRAPPARYAPPSQCNCPKPPPYTCLPGTQGACTCPTVGVTPPEIDCRGGPKPQPMRLQVYGPTGLLNTDNHLVAGCSCPPQEQVTCKPGTEAIGECPAANGIDPIDCKGRPQPKVIWRPDEFGCAPILPPTCIAGTEGPADAGRCPVCVTYPKRYVDCKGRRRAYVAPAKDDCGCPLQPAIECLPGTDACPTCPTTPLAPGPEYDCKGHPAPHFQVLDNKCGCGQPALARCQAGTAQQTTCAPFNLETIPEIDCLKRPLEEAILIINSGVAGCPHTPLAQCKPGTEIEITTSPLGCECKISLTPEDPIDCQGKDPPSPPASTDACGCPLPPGPTCIPGTSATPQIAPGAPCSAKPIRCYPYKCTPEDVCALECSSDSECRKPFVCHNQQCVSPAEVGAPLGCFANPSSCGLYQCKGQDGVEGVCATSCTSDSDCASNAYCVVNQCVEGRPEDDGSRCSQNLGLCGAYACGLSRDITIQPAFDFCRTSCSIDAHCAIDHYCDPPACVPGTPPGITCRGRGNCGAYACGEGRNVAPTDSSICRTSCSENDHCAYGYKCVANACVDDPTQKNSAPECTVPGTCPQGITDAEVVDEIAECEAKYKNPKTAARKCKRAKIEKTLTKAFKKFVRFLKGRGNTRPNRHRKPRRDTNCKYHPERCFPYLCGAPGTPPALLPFDSICQLTCSSDSECVAGYYCHAGDCIAKGSDATECLDSRMCGSGHCQSSGSSSNDGICCNQDCSGTCRSCSLPGFLGQCQQVPLWQDLDGDCGICRACGPIRTPDPPAGCAKGKVATFIHASNNGLVTLPFNPYQNHPEYEPTDSGRSHPYRFTYSLRHDIHDATHTHKVLLGGQDFVVHHGDRSVTLSKGGSLLKPNNLRTWTRVRVTVTPVEDEDSTQANIVVSANGISHSYQSNEYPKIDNAADVRLVGGHSSVAVDSILIEVNVDLEWETVYHEEFPSETNNAIFASDTTFTSGVELGTNFQQEGVCQPTPSSDTDRCAPLPYGRDPKNDCGPFGTCNGEGGCICANDDVNGHWAGETCNECKAGYGGDHCLKKLHAVPVQYASSVTSFSSQTSPGAFSAEAALGEPNVFPRHESSQDAWEPNQSGTQYIDVKFQRPVYPDGVMVFESFNPGSVIRISTRDSTGAEDVALPGDAAVTSTFPRYGAIAEGRFSAFSKFPTGQFITHPKDRPVAASTMLEVSQFNAAVTLNLKEAVQEGGKLTIRYFVDGIRVGYPIATGSTIDSLTLTSVAISRGWKILGNKLFVPGSLPTFSVNNGATVDHAGVINADFSSTAVGPIILEGNGQAIGAILQVNGPDTILLTSFAQSQGWIVNDTTTGVVARPSDVSLYISEQVNFKPLDTIRLPAAEVAHGIGGSRADEVLYNPNWDRVVRVKEPPLTRPNRRPKEAFFKFDLSEIEADLAFDKANVILYRKVTGNCAEGSTTTQTVTLVDNNWSRTTLTYNNRPTTDLQTLTTFEVTHGRGGAYIIDVSDIVRTRPTGNSFTLRVVGAESYCVTKYFSLGHRRSERHPTLQILPPNDNDDANTEPVPGCIDGTVAAVDVAEGTVATAQFPPTEEVVGPEAEDVKLSFALNAAAPTEGLASGAEVTVDANAVEGGPYSGSEFFRPWRGKQCRFVRFPFNFPSEQTSQIQVQLSIAHRDAPETKVDNAVVAWADQITNTGFTACVQERSSPNGDPDDEHVGGMSVEWLAYTGLNRLPAGARGEVRVPQPTQPDIHGNGAVSLLNANWENDYLLLQDDPTRFNFPAWTGTHCEDISFGSVFERVPFVFVTLNHRTASEDVDIDAVSHWVEEVTVRGFRVCMKELAQYDQQHSGNTHINYLAFVNPDGEPGPTPYPYSHSGYPNSHSDSRWRRIWRYHHHSHSDSDSRWRRIWRYHHHSYSHSDSRWRRIWRYHHHSHSDPGYPHSHS
eukprot:TRINITY_DN373_c0_g1_i2.p1 TRINITY_DN373_c0_g1~~TRINITY_DN373_c0_g1_i2.p1  ORF type:complete len:1984 (+),score=431.20 TRINITY_DN373_c0_g1_i2:189-6140(+)